MRFVAAGHAATGLCRDTNEDGVGVFLDDGLVIVCDGMGGNYAGSLVPPVVLSGFREGVRDLATRDVAEPLSAMTSLAQLMHERVVASLAALGPLAQTAAGTAGLVWLRGERAVFAHAGDTRLYLFRDRTLTQMWAEHTLLRMLQNNHAATPEMRAAAMRYTNVVTTAFGIGAALTPDVGEFELRVGDVLLLVTDGVTNQLSDAQIVEALTVEGGADASLAALFDALARTPRSDDASAIVVQVLPSPARATVATKPQAVLSSSGLRDRSVGRWLKPLAPHAREVSKLAAESRTSDELLERLCLHGMLPTHWCDDGIARFDCKGEQTLTLTSQPSRELLVKLGADGGAVAEIEALAAELRWRLRPWGFLGREGVCWVPLRTYPPHGGGRGELHAWLRGYAHSPQIAAVKPSVQVPPDRWQWHLLLCEVVLAASQWDHSDEPVPSWNRAVRAHPYADLASPAEVLWEIAARGYVVLDAAREGVVVGVP